MEAFSVDISYGQLCVFDAKLGNPFNDWTPVHVAQGFAWRPGSVSFATLESTGLLSVEVVRVVGDPSIPTDAVRVISVPFTVPAHSRIVVASIDSESSLELPAGDYELTFAHGATARSLCAVLSFRVTNTEVQPRIARADPGLAPPDELLMTARPA